MVANFIGPIGLLGVLLVGACSDAPASDERYDVATSGLLEFSGTTDGSGHVMLPAGTAGECELHHAPFDDDVIAILRGMPYMGGPDYHSAQRDLFPYDATLFYSCGGGDPYWVAVSYCPECRAAELAWERAAAAAGDSYAYDAAMRDSIRAGLPPLDPAIAASLSLR